MPYYYIEHKPSKRKYTPNEGRFQNGRNWRKSKATLYPAWEEAFRVMNIAIDQHVWNEKPLKIRDWNGAIRERDFRVVEVNL